MNKDIPQDKGATHSTQTRRKWLRVVAWIAAGLATLPILVAIGLFILLNSSRFHAYLLNTAQKQASEALGVRVQLQNFKAKISTLSLDLYGITVDGARPYANPPLLQLDHAQVGVRIVSILHGKWYLDSVVIDRPIARVFVDAQGVSNIPTFKSSGSSSGNTSLFDLAIRHAVLDRGEIYFNDKQSVLAADVHDVEFQASFNPLLQKYSGKLAYADGHLVSGSLKPIPHNLNATFDATPTTLHLSQAKLSSGPSILILSATLEDYTHPTVQAHYDATVDGKQLQQIFVASSIPSGQVRAIGDVQYTQTASLSLLDSLIVKGNLNSRQLDVRIPALRSPIDNLAAHYSLVNGNAVLTDMHADLLGGEIAAAGTMSHIGGDSRSEFHASLHGVSLADVERAVGSITSLQQVALNGKLNAEAKATWGKTLDDLVAHTDATINAQLAQSTYATRAMRITSPSTTSPTSTTTIPIESAVHATYTASNKQIAVDKSYLRTPQTNLTMNGVVSDHSSLDLRLQADNLTELETLADLFRTPPSGQPLQPLGLAGTASFQGKVEGTTAAPHLTGQFVAVNFHVNGTEWKSLRTNVDVSPSFASLRNASLEPALHGHIDFSASTALTKWSFTNTSPIHANLNASQLSIADISKLTGRDIPVTGSLNANLKLNGTVLSPIGNGNILLTNVTAYDQPVQSIKLTFDGSGNEVHGDLAMQLPTGTLQSKLSVRPKEKSYVAQLTASGIHLDKLQALSARHIDATGILDLRANGQGTFDNPQLNATLQIPQLTLQKQTVTGLNLRMQVANHLANAELSTAAVNTNIQAKVQVHLTGDYLTDATLDTQAIPLQPLLAIYAPGQATDVTGQTEVHATLNGPLKNKNLLEAHVTIPTLKLAYGNKIRLAAALPIHVDYKNGILDLQRASIRGTDTDLQFQGSIPTSGTGPMSVLLQGTVNLQLAQIFDPDIRSSGELKFNLNSYGAASGPDIGGDVQIVDAAFISGDLPTGLQHGNGVLTLTKDRLNIQKFQGTVGGGTLTAQGAISYRSGVRFDLGLAAQGIRVLYPQGVRESVDASLRLTGSSDNAQLAGSVNLSDVSFTPAFDLSSFVSQFSGGVETPPTAGFSQNLQLNLAVRSANDVSLVSRTLSIDGAANLQVRGTAANPVILGRINLNNGDIILNGERFLLSGGTVEFVNPSVTQPVVNLSITTTIQQYDVSLRFNGPVDQLRTEYSSDPALPTADIINLLAFGSTQEGSNANPTSSTNQQAESLVASQVSSQVTSRISKIAGISQLSINPVLAGSSSQSSLGANITIQQRVTGNLFITFTNNVGSTQSQTIQGQYQVSPRVAVSATRDQNGGFAFDTLIKKTW